MTENYIHTSIHIKQSPKYRGGACGDVFNSYRDENSTTLVLCDGLGSGIKANIYANMLCSRIIHLLKNGASVQKAFEMTGETMNEAWGENTAFAVFTIVRILNNGNTSILSYDMPDLLLISEGFASKIESNISYWKKARISKASLRLRINEGLLLMSDGITQAGMGKIFTYGWENDGIEFFLNRWIKEPKPDCDKLIEAVHDKAREFWGKGEGDDCSVIFAYNRKGITLNILSGTPKDKTNDDNFVLGFMQSQGIKVVCGGSTLKMLARITKQEIEINNEGSSITPTSYKIKNITLATEGIITLNQVYNILHENIEISSTDSPVFELADYLSIADKINFWVGSSQSISGEIDEQKQQGIRNRPAIVELIADKLRSENKLVIIRNY